MLRRWVLTLFSLVVLWTPHLAGAQSTALPAGVSQVVAVEGITEYRLPNGLQVLLVPDDAKPSTTVNVTYRVGSRHENYGETGMAHLLEHLIFKGTPTTRNVLGEISKRGMRANGTTWFDRTNYFASFAANDEQLRWYLSWQADAMVNSFIAKADLDTEMTVVRNEMESGENNPFRVLLQKAMASMYQWHNYGKSTIGARSDVENVDIARLQAFYRQHYQPDNATLTVAGKFDAAKVLQWVAESFGPIPKPSRALQPTYTIDPAQDGETAVTVRRVGGTPLLLAGFHVPAGASRDFAALSLLSQVMGTAPAGRLHKRLTERQLAAATFGFAWGLAEPGPLFLGAQLSPGQDVDQARAELLAAIDALATEPVSAEELERVRKQWLNAWELGFTDPERVGVALSDAISRGDWRLFFLDRNHVRAVTVEDMNRVASQYLKRDNRTVATYLPVTQTDRAPAPARVDLAAALKDFRGDAAAAQVESFDPTPENLDARTQLSTLPSGLKVALLSKGARGGVVHARLALRFGDVQTLQGLSTVSALGASLVDKGGAGLTRQQIRDRLDALRAQVAVGASDQGWSVNITTVRQHLPEVVKLVGRLLREPSFPAEALEEVRRQALSGLEQGRKEPGAVVADVLARHGNPYPRGDLRHAPSFDEREQDLKAVTVVQLRDFHSRFLSAAQGQFSVVGDFDAAALREALATAMGDWKQPAAGAARYVRAPQPLNVVKPERFVLRTPDKQRANLQAQLALPLNDLDTDHPAVLVGNFILGGNPASRLWARVREREGLSYDVRSFIGWNPVDRNSTWTATAIFAPENQPKVEAAVKEEIARVLREGVSAQELAQAQQALLNQRRLSRAQDPVVAGGWQFNLEHGRSFAQARRLDDQIAAVTVEQVNAALRRHLDPARIVWAWAGDFKQP
ncbi:MAG: insulinase family protein [Rubrivivax sp.]|nr:insulinase family protein [Rubrivivax sp.]